MERINELTGEIVDAAFLIHKSLGPGLLESVYEAVLARELERRGLKVERQRELDFEYDGMVFKESFRIDLYVERRIIVELKSVEKLSPVHAKQALTYIRLLNLPVGLLINFGGALLKNNVRRIMNNGIEGNAFRLPARPSR